MSAPDRLERDLAQWFAESALPRTPDYVDDIIATTSRERQRPAWAVHVTGWLSAVRTVRFGDLGAPRPLRMVVLLGLLVALLAAIALSVGSPKRPLPPPVGPAGNGLIFFGHQGDIHTLDLATRQVKGLVLDPAYDRLPRVSLDGTRVAFLRSVDGGHRLVIVDDDGSHPMASQGDPFVDHDPDSVGWSPDGAWIALTARTPGGYGVFVVDSHDGTVTHLTDFLGMDLSWRPGQPEGRQQLMLVSGPAWRPSLSLFSLDEGEIMTIEPEGGVRASLRPIGWTPDGKSFAYQVTDAERDVEMTHLRDIESGQETILRVGYGRISNDGTRIVGYDGTEDDHQLCVLTIDIGHCVPIGGAMLGGYPEHSGGLQWSPDDSAILVLVGDGTPRVVAPDGSSALQLGLEHDGGQSWQRVHVEPSPSPSAPSPGKARRSATPEQ